MNIVAIIPARMGSSRFPGKPLKKINGVPMIRHVYDQVKNNNNLLTTIVATCDHEIEEYIHSIDGNVIMTSSKHERASDRCAEALLIYEKKQHIKVDIVVMVQGDEPMIKSEMISEAINPMLKDSTILVTNLLSNIKTEKEFKSRNSIKVVCDNKSNALYFSREPIPHMKTYNMNFVKKQICVIPFRRDFLIKYTNMDPTELEVLESVDMMRVLEHGYHVKMVPTKYDTFAVDTPEDLINVEKLIKS